MADVEMRPNIRIEITNNLAESMEVDEEKNNVEEEGEILECGEVAKEVKTIPEPVVLERHKLGSRIWANADGGFTTGVDIFEKEEQEKLLERAKRFTLKPDEINTFTDQQLQQLHDSLGIAAESEKDIRFEAIHMHGTEEMSTEDVLNYFVKYGPSGIEWIDDSSCNVVWLDKISAARALHYVSKAIRNLPVKGPCDPFARELGNGEEDLKGNEESCRSVLLRNANREVELREDKEMQEVYDKESMVDVSEIECPIPPGYWRLGVQHLKAKYILLRFALITDKKPYKAEKFSNYYKKYGNPNYGNMKGIISESCKQKFKGIFDRNREIANRETVKDKDPWGGLAESWDEDAQFREREYRNPDFVEMPSKPELKNPALMERLGFKRAHESETEPMEAEEAPKKKIKIPRMRMYADEEEQKIKRKKQLMAVKTIVETRGNLEARLERSDLRNILGNSTVRKAVNVLPRVEEAEENVQVIDLGTKLKNRQRKIEQRSSEEPIKIRSDDSHKRTEEHRYRRRSRSPRSKSVYKNRLHSDRYESARRRRKSPSSYYVEEFDHQKPRSKVAVVIKTQKIPAVASKIWSRINERDRLKTVSEGKLRRYTSSSSESSSESESSSSSSSESSSDSSSEEELPKRSSKTLERPGFRSHLKSVVSRLSSRKSPLRIEISNDHFKRE